jgi:F-type H+-transporting ATPase subunit alpha
LPAAQQIAVLLAVTSGLFEGLPIEMVGKAQQAIHRAVREELSELARKIEEGRKLSDEDRERLLAVAGRAVGA